MPSAKHGSEGAGQQEYVLFETGVKSCSSSNACATLALIIALGFGSHAGKEAIAAAQPALEGMGLSPLEYAMLSVAPVAAGIVTPVLWGALYDRGFQHRVRVLQLAPAGEFFGALFISAGLHKRGHKLLSNGLLLLGFLLTSLCKSGVHVAQVATAARVCGRLTAVAFGVMVVSKHLLSMIITWLVPRILVMHEDAASGVLRVSLAILLPNALAAASGLILSRWETEAAPLRRFASEVGPGVVPSAVVLMLGGWRALTVGSLHAYHSVRIKLVMSLGLPLVDAGSRLAAYDALAIGLVTPMLIVACTFLGVKPMLFAAPLMALVASLLLASTFHDGDALHFGLRESLAVLTMSIAQVSSPIVPNALMPGNTRRLGRAYGVTESIFILVQMGLALLVGASRSAAGYRGALTLISGGLLCALGLSAVLAPRVNEVDTVRSSRLWPWRRSGGGQTYSYT